MAKISWSKLKVSSIASLALVSALATPVWAAPGDVSLEIVLSGGTTILYYQSNLSVTINAASLLATAAPCAAAGTAPNTYSSCPDTTAATSTATALGTTGIKATMTPALNTNVGTTGVSLANLPLVLDNVWAVRAIGGNSTSTTVGVTLNTANATLTSAGSGSIVLKGIGVGVGAVPGTITSPGTTTTASTGAFADPGLVNVQNGYVTLALDLTGATATSATAFKGPVGSAQYTITVTAT